MRTQPGDVVPEAATARGARRGRSVERDAFISYRHDPDSRVALAVKQALERLAKPWYRRRALSVFLDSANLGAADDLPQRIERELMGARFLVLLACPESAASHWVTREALFWCEHKGTSHLLVVLTGGELVWDEEAGAYSDASTRAEPSRAVRAEDRGQVRRPALGPWGAGSVAPAVALPLRRGRPGVAAARPRPGGDRRRGSPAASPSHPAGARRGDRHRLPRRRGRRRRGRSRRRTSAGRTAGPGRRSVARSGWRRSTSRRATWTRRSCCRSSPPTSIAAAAPSATGPVEP